MTEETIIYDWEETRIDSFLPKHFSHSRNFFQHILERGGVLVNQKSVKKSYKLKRGDKISIDSLERYLSPVLLEESEYVDIPVVHEDEDYLVLDKPKWVLSHPNSIWDLSTASVVSFLYHKYKSLPSIWNFIRAGLIHRLDKETDWFMIVALSEKGLSYYKDLFNQKSEQPTIEQKEAVPLKKFYYAEVDILSQWKSFLNQIKDRLPYTIISPVKPKVAHVTAFKTGITKILEITYLSDTTAALKIEILTGRTHQIRYHLSSHGIPIIGDYLYHPGESGWDLRLSCCGLQFLDHRGENQSFSKQPLYNE